MFSFRSDDIKPLPNLQIDCTVLSDLDWETLASQVAAKFTFGDVSGIPYSGAKFAEKLAKYATKDTSDPFLIVDDVLTTGVFFDHALNRLNIPIERPVIGVVVFSQVRYVSEWIHVMFQFW